MIFFHSPGTPFLFTQQILKYCPHFMSVNADALLKGKNMDGVYDCHSDNGSMTVDHISFREVVSSGFTSMDTMAITYCEENGIPVVVFNLLEPGNISRALCGERVGTLIDQEGRVS
ncbi:hypothetical protein CRYUN_Cryun41cG0049300 [Craigia yunnanensis]